MPAPAKTNVNPKIAASIVAATMAGVHRPPDVP